MFTLLVDCEKRGDLSSSAFVIKSRTVKLHHSLIYGSAHADARTPHSVQSAEVFFTRAGHGVSCDSGVTMKTIYRVAKMCKNT